MARMSEFSTPKCLDFTSVYLGFFHVTWLRLWEAMLGLCLLVSMAGASEGERLCGKQLADALDLVCYGRGFYWSEKRSAPASPGLAKTGAAAGQAGGARARRSLERRAMRSRGVVVECCLNACTYDVLESYCARPGDAPADVLSFWNNNQDPLPAGGSAPVISPQHSPVSLQDENGNPEMAKSGRHNRHYFFVHLSPRPTRSPLA